MISNIKGIITVINICVIIWNQLKMPFYLAYRLKFINVMEETTHEKRCLSGDSKPSSGMALGMFGLTMADCGHKQSCSQILHKYRLSFKSIQYKTLWLERKLTLQYFKVVSCSVLLVIWVELIKERGKYIFQVNSQCLKTRTCLIKSKNTGPVLTGGIKS